MYEPKSFMEIDWDRRKKGIRMYTSVLLIHGAQRLRYDSHSGVVAKLSREGFSEIKLECMTIKTPLTKGSVIITEIHHSGGYRVDGPWGVYLKKEGWVELTLEEAKDIQRIMENPNKKYSMVSDILKRMEDQ